MLMEMAMKCGGLTQMSLQLRDATRLAYAQSLDDEYHRRSSRVEVKDFPELNTTFLDVLDLGDQLARLWALTSNTIRAKYVYQGVIKKLKVEEGKIAIVGKKARLDRTIAGFVEMLANNVDTNNSQAMQEMYGIMRGVHPNETLPVIWEGVSVSFLERFLKEYKHGELDFLSTDAFVERIVKPHTKCQTDDAMLNSHGMKGMSLVEKLQPNDLGKATYFISHAWKQTFHVPESAPWRGGLLEAIIGSTTEENKESTYFWFDAFNVNQHMRSPYGGLMAFAFDPLRNAMVRAGHVKLFFETWDDPRPLTRVWCLDEIRIALLLGKDVRVFMPPQVMESFKKNATMEMIERVTTRIDVSYASASFESDRVLVLQRVESTIGSQALNIFCKEIVRLSLIRAAGLTVVIHTKEREHAWNQIYQSLLEKSKMESTKTPQTIEIWRAVAMMKRRIDMPGTQWASQGAQLLSETAELAIKYYGPTNQTSSDIAEQARIAQAEQKEAYKALIRRWQKCNNEDVATYDVFSKNQILGSNIIDRIVELAKERGFDKGGRILDVGCGTGACLRALSKLMPGATFVGLDPAKTSLTFAQDHFEHTSNVTYVEGAIENLPSMFDADGEFDMVLSTWGGFRWNIGGPVMERLTKKNGGLTMMVHNWGFGDDFSRLWPVTGVQVFLERRSQLTEQEYNIERTCSIQNLETENLFKAFCALFGDEEVIASRKSQFRTEIMIAWKDFQ